MAGIFVNVENDISNLRKLKSEINEIKSALKGINVQVDFDIKKDLETQLRSLTEQYDALASKISETEGKIRLSTQRINETTQKIVEAQQKLVGAAQSGGSPQQSNAETTTQTASVQAQARAYDELKAEIDAVLGSRTENVRRMVEEQNAIRLINAELKKMEKQTVGGNYSPAQIARIEQLNSALLTHKAALAEVRQVLNNNAKIDNAAADSMTRLSKELERMKMAFRELTVEEQKSPFGQELLATINEVDAKMKQFDASIGNFQRNVGNYGSAFNGIGTSVQQIVRELPSAAMGLNTFFLAISNNLPILVDEIRRAQAANEALKQSGQKSTPVWKQVASSLFSWQTALMAGIALLSVYGKDLANWVKGLWEGKEAATGLKEAQEQINESFKENSGGLGEQIALVKKLQIEWNSLGGDLEKQKRFVKENQSEFDKLGVSISNVKEAENLLVTKTQAFINSLVKRAKAAAGLKLAAEKYEEALKKQIEMEKMSDKVKVKETMTVQSVAGASTVNTGREIEIDNKQKKLLKEDIDLLHQEAEAYLTLSTAQKEQAEQELKNAGITLSGTDKTNVEVKKVKDMANEIEAMKKQNAQDEINLEKDLEQRRLKQIEHDYKTRMEAIAKFEKDLLEFRKGNLTNEDKVLVSDAKRLAKQKKERELNASNNQKLLEQYRGYFEQRKAIEEKYMKDRQALEAQGASQEALAENEYQMNKALEAIDMEFAMREEGFEVWAAKVVNISLEQLTELINKAEAEIAEMEKSDPNNKNIGKARAAVQVLKEARLNKKKETNTDDEPSPKASEKWKELYETLRKVEKQFGEIGDAIGGTVGEIISTAGSVTSSTITMVEGLVRLTDGSISAIKGTSEASTVALQTVEKASVILAVVGAALQIATKIANMFGADYSNYNKAKENYEAYTEVLDEVISKQKELIETMTGKAAVEASEEALELVKKQREAAIELGKMRLNAGASVGSHSIGIRTKKNMTEEGWSEALDALGTSYYNKIREGRMEGLFDLSIEQLEKLKSEAPLFWAQLDGDVRGYLNQIIETNEATEQLKDTLNESLTGISFTDFSGDILDSLYDVEKSAEDIFDDMSDYMRKALIKAMYVKNYEPEMQKWYDQWAKAMEDGSMSDSEKNSLEALKESIINGATQAASQINSMFDTSKESDNEIENFISNLKNALSSVDVEAKNVADNIYDYFRQAMISSLYDNSYKTLMEQLYKDYEDAMLDGVMSEQELVSLSDKVDSYVAQMTEGVSKVNKLFADKLKEAESFDDLENEFKSFSDSILSAMQNAKVEASSVAEDISDTLRKELIEAMYVEQYEPRIKEIWEKWKTITSDGIVTDEERTRIQNDIQAIAKEVAEASREMSKDWIDAGEEVNETFKSFSDSIKSVLYDAEATAEDVAKNIYRYMRNAFIDASFASQLEPLVQKWFDLYEGFNADNIISDTERAELDKLIADISKAGEDLNDAANKLFPSLDTGAEKAAKEAEEAARKAEEEAREAAEKAAAEAQRIREQEESEWQSFSDNIVSSLYDIEATSADISKDMGETMRQALIKAMYVKNYEPQMRKWYNAWQNAMGDGNLTDDEKSTLDSMKDAIINDAMKEVNAINQMFGSIYSQEATAKGFSAMSQETGEELNGRFTAMQISIESQTRSINLLEIKASDIQKISSDTSLAVDDIRTHIANSYLELISIRENTGLSAAYLKSIKDDISVVKENTRNL